jgi:nitric oxide reductase subunit B
MPGDVVFILGGALPVLWITYRGIRFTRDRGSVVQVKEILFTDIVDQIVER